MNSVHWFWCCFLSIDIVVQSHFFHTVVELTKCSRIFLHFGMGSHFSEKWGRLEHSIWLGFSSPFSSPAMYSGVCICLLLAVLSMSSSGQQNSESHNANPVVTNLGQNLKDNHRNIRSPATGRSIQWVDGNADQKANLGALLAKYLQQARRGILNTFLSSCSFVLISF